MISMTEVINALPQTFRMIITDSKEIKAVKFCRMTVSKRTWSKSVKTSSKLITSISDLGSTFPFT